jgi:hypothetical protein
MPPEPDTTQKIPDGPEKNQLQLCENAVVAKC